MFAPLPGQSSPAWPAQTLLASGPGFPFVFIPMLSLFETIHQRARAMSFSLRFVHKTSPADVSFLAGSERGSLSWQG